MKYKKREIIVNQVHELKVITLLNYALLLKSECKFKSLKYIIFMYTFSNYKREI